MAAIASTSCSPPSLPASRCSSSLGVCAGLALGLGASRYVASLFYQVKATDADMIALPACAIPLTALLATLPAVLRALRTNPTEILRAE